MTSFSGTKRRDFLRAGLAVTLGGIAAPAQPPKPTVVLTFDDAVKSHRTFVAPLLKDLGFAASFFVTHRWMDDDANFMSWEEIAGIHEMGFEIGNHSWTHADFSSPKNAARLEGELALVENALSAAGVPKPVSFAWCGNRFGPEALGKLRELGYRFARRGPEPEAPNRALAVALPYDPERHDPLLIPTTGNATPDWTFEHFRRVVALAEQGEIVVLQFHGVPDKAHNWVHTPPEMFRKYMNYLAGNGFRTLALRDLEQFADPEDPPDDPLAKRRVPEPEDGKLELPPEAEATRKNLAYWMPVMIRDHRYSAEEAAQVAWMRPRKVEREYGRLREEPVEASAQPLRIRPYPGGRHPRIGFLDGAINPLRGTKASVFLPWNAEHYAVVDVPEAIFSNLGLTYLAHTHIPAIWDERNIVIENVDWERTGPNSLRSRWELPNGIVFGASVEPEGGAVAMDLWLTNGTKEPLTGLRTQICVMLKGAPGFNEQTLENKIFDAPVAAVRSEEGERWILTAWQRGGRSWGNRKCPCFHADPVLPDCAPGGTVRVKGGLWFYEGSGVEAEIAQLKERFG